MNLQKDCRVKIFISGNVADMEERVNEYLKNNSVNIIKIYFSPSALNDNIFHYCYILYRQ